MEVGKMWVVLRKICESFLVLPDGKYLLMREPNEAKLTTYSLPDTYDFNDENVEAVADEDD
jgi:hypothetical protein